MDLNLKGLNALVCGSTQGIGLGIARKLSEYGVRVTLMARNEIKLKEVVDQINGNDYLVADFEKVTDLGRVLPMISKKEISILINNTGGPDPGIVHQAEWHEFEQTFNMHVRWSHELTKAVIPFMKQNNFGRIINIISTSVKIPIQGLGVSNTIRGAMANWAKTMSQELGPSGITINNILPGFISTQRLQQIIDDRVVHEHIEEKDVVNKMTKEIPVRRFGTIDEVGDLASFLCSSKASYINGVSIPIDGGKTGSI